MKNTGTEERELHTAQNIINAGTGQSADVEQMCEWFEKHPKARKLLTDAELLAGEIATIDPERKERNLARLRTRVRGYKRARMVRWATISVATSAAMVLLCFGIFKYIGVVQPEPELLVASVPVVKDSVPTLIFASGEKMDMTEYAVNKKVIDVVHVVARATDETSSVLNVYKVPRMFTSRLALPDSTIVYLNSDSELRFPTSFTGDERRVYLKGEAFFDVVKDSGKQFVVALPEGDIKVYGTRFCITDYGNKPMSAVLTRGSIGFTTTGGEEVRLKPADRLTYEATEGVLKVEQVDTTLYMSWINKMFVFKGQPLGEIMETLSRWYDLDCVFASEDLKQVRLSGRLNRYQNIQVLLKTYEGIAGLRFEIEGRQVFISRK